MSGYQVHMNQDFLMHHGVQGQKHGKRRYQNYDGSLTPEGREHYGIGQRVKDAVNRGKANYRLDEMQYGEFQKRRHEARGDVINRGLAKLDQKRVDRNRKKLDKVVAKLSDRNVMIPQERTVFTGVKGNAYEFTTMVGDRYVSKGGHKHKAYEKQQKRNAEENARLNAAELLRYGEGKKSRQMAAKEIAKMNDKDLKREAKNWREAAEHLRKNGDPDSKTWERNARMYEKEMNKRSGADFDGTSKKKAQTAPPKSERVDLIKKATMEANGGKQYDTVHDYTEAYKREGKRLNDEWKKMKNY